MLAIDLNGDDTNDMMINLVGVDGDVSGIFIA
jgi:hypothetical protein